MKLEIAGQVLRQGDAAYEKARQNAVWNGRKPNRFPKLIVKATNENDVVEAVRYARANKLKMAVRAGGHSWAGWSVRDEAMLLDLSAMRDIKLDLETGIVSVNPSVKGGDELDPILEPHGLMFAGGHCPSVGVGGFLLQGGMGWNARGWGWAAESVVAIDVVTANGELMRADADQNSDLYWAARGAGPGFFGVVTKFYLQTRARPKALTQSTYLYPTTLHDEVMTWMTNLHSSIATSVEIVVVGIIPPEMTEPMLVVHLLAMVDTYEEAREALLPFETCPVLEQALMRQFAQPTTFAEERREQVRANPEGMRFAVDNAWLEGDAQTVVPLMREAFTTLPTAQTFTLWFSMAPLRTLPDMALSLQTEVYFAVYTIWQDESEDVPCRAWLANQMQRLEPVTAGQYLGDSDLGVRPLRFISNEAFAKLEQLRKKYDPENLFHSYLAKPDAALNQNTWQLEVKP
jgi:FAD/FMN-containing dehydrogenase